MALYAGFVKTTGILHVYDRHDNRYEAVGNLPVSIVVMAGILNKVEYGFSEIIETSMSPIITSEDAGGGRAFDGFARLYTFVNSKLKFNSEYDRMTLDAYMKECVMWDLEIGGSTYDAAFGDTDFVVNTLANGAYGAVFTTVYTDLSKGGEHPACMDAYNGYAGATLECPDCQGFVGLKNLLTPDYFENIFNSSFCSDLGYNKNDPNQLNTCRDSMIAMLTNLAGYAGGNPGILLSQMYFAQWMKNYQLNANPAELQQFIANRQIGVGMTGAGIVANEWVPKIRSLVYAIVVLMTPFLLLMFAAYGLETVKTLAGMFVLTAVWGIIDIVLFYTANNLAYTWFSQIRDAGGISYNALFLFDTEAARVLALLGVGRTAGLGLSIYIVSQVMKLGGGEATAQGAGSLQGKLDDAGKDAGEKSLTVEGRSESLDRMESGLGTLDYQSRTNQLDRVAAIAREKEHRMQEQKMMRKLGIRPEEQASHDVSRWMGGYKQYNTAMGALGYDSENIYERAEFNKAVESGMMTQRMADAANKKYGTDRFREGMKTDLTKAVDTDGNLNITDAIRTTATGTESWTGSGWVYKDNLNKEQAENKVKELKGKELNTEANNLAGLVASLPDNASINAHEEYDRSGNNLSSLNHGFTTKVQNLRTGEIDISKSESFKDDKGRGFAGLSLVSGRYTQIGDMMTFSNALTADEKKISGDYDSKAKKWISGKMEWNDAEGFAWSSGIGEKGEMINPIGKKNYNDKYGKGEMTAYGSGVSVLDGTAIVNGKEFAGRTTFLDGKPIYTQGSSGMNIHEQDIYNRERERLIIVNEGDRITKGYKEDIFG